MLRVAFKEWAAVCRALAEGRQSVILRKGGIAEVGGVFRPEYDRFWLYPTYHHEQPRKGLKPEYLPLIDAAEVDRPPAGVLRLTHFVEVEETRFVDRLEDALAIDQLHVWSEETVRQRYHYRTPGLYVLTVRVFRVRTPMEIPEDPAYAGCKTWVELDRDVEEQPADRVVTDS
jgi:hypothetical protein